MDDVIMEPSPRDSFEITGDVVIMYSNKGGTGKTSTTYQIIRNMMTMKPNVKILIMDNDQQENITSMFIPPILSKSMKGLDISTCTIKALLQFDVPVPIKIDSNIYFLFFDFLDPMAEASLHSSPIKQIVSRNVNELSKIFDLIIIDCNPAHLPLTSHLIKSVRKMVYLMDLSEFSKDGFLTTMRLRKHKPIIVINKVDIQKVSGKDENKKQDVTEVFDHTAKIIDIFNCKSIILPNISDFDAIMEHRKIVNVNSDVPTIDQNKKTYTKVEYHKRLIDLIGKLKDNSNFDMLIEPKVEMTREMFDSSKEYKDNYFYVYIVDKSVIFGRSKNLSKRFDKKLSDSLQIYIWKCNERFETVIKHHFRHLKELDSDERIQSEDNRTTKMILDSIFSFANKFYD